jgi:hypothetical protein
VRFTGSEAHGAFADFGFVEGTGIEGTWTKLVLILVVGVAVAFALRHFLFSDTYPRIGFYKTDLTTGKLRWS